MKRRKISPGLWSMIWFEEDSDTHKLMFRWITGVTSRLLSQVAKTLYGLSSVLVFITTVHPEAPLTLMVQNWV